MSTIFFFGGNIYNVGRYESLLGFFVIRTRIISNSLVSDEEKEMK